MKAVPDVYMRYIYDLHGKSRIKEPKLECGSAYL